MLSVDKLWLWRQPLVFVNKVLNIVMIIQLFVVYGFFWTIVAELITECYHRDSMACMMWNIDSLAMQTNIWQSVLILLVFLYTFFWFIFQFPSLIFGCIGSTSISVKPVEFLTIVTYFLVLEFLLSSFSNKSNFLKFPLPNWNVQGFLFISEDRKHDSGGCAQYFHYLKSLWACFCCLFFTPWFWLIQTLCLTLYLKSYSWK